MVKTYQHPAGTGCQAKLKTWSFYAWLVFCGFTGDIFCADTVNGKQIEAQTVSTTSSNDDATDAHSLESSLDANSDKKSHYEGLYRFVRAVPPVKTTSESSLEYASEDNRKPDYVLKIPLSVLRQYELYRVLRWQENGKEDFEKRQTIIPIPRFGRSDEESDNDIQDTDKMFHYSGTEQDNLSDRYLEELFKSEVTDNTLPIIRKSRSMLLLSSPKSEETTKKPTQTFVLPYPRPGRSNKYGNVEKTKIEQFTPDTPERFGDEDNLSKSSSINNNNDKSILPNPRLRRSSLGSVFEKDEDKMIIENWLSGAKSNPLSQRLSKEYLSGNTMDENEDNSFFVIPYPRPGKKSLFKLKNRNKESKNAEKEIADYVLPYPRPGKKSGRETSIKYPSSKSKDVKNIASHTLILPYPRPGRADESSFYISDTYDQNKDTDNIMESDGLFRLRNKKFENELILPYVRSDRNFDKIVPYPRPGRSASHVNEVSRLLSDDKYIDSNGFLARLKYYKNPEDGSSDVLRFKRSSSVIPYPRFGRSDTVVPYPRLGRSNSVVPYPRLGRSNSVVPYPRFGRSKRGSSVVPYPRLGRSGAIVPYPRPGRSESVVPYPRPGRAESMVPYPRPGRSDSLVPYPRPGRAESMVPYPRPGRSDLLVPYPRPGRSESLVPYPRPGRSDSELPYPRLTHSSIEKTSLPNKYEKTESWLLPNIRPGRSNLKQEDSHSKGEYILPYLQPEISENEDNVEYSGIKSNTFNEISSNTRNARTTNNQGYVLPHPRIGRSAFPERNERESIDTDTVIPYPRLGRSEKETIPFKLSSEGQNSVHKLNKHMLKSVDDSVYLLPYPRPGR